MTGTSARETSRSARRMRPTLSGSSSQVNPPVLFRLPSISSPAPHSGREPQPAVSSAAPTGGSMVIGASASALPPQTFSPLVGQPLKQTLAQPLAQSAAQPAMQPLGRPADAANAASDVRTAAEEPAAAAKRQRQQLINAVIIALLLAALAVLSLIAFRRQPVKAELVTAPEKSASESQAGDPLASLADLRVPPVQEKSASDAAPPSSGVNQAKPALPADSAKRNDLSAVSQPNEPSDSLITGLETNRLMRADAAKPSPAQVQLGTPVPMLSSTDSTSLVDSATKRPEASTPELPLTTPRYETVSGPNSTKAPTDKPRSGTTGSSPDLYDGASSQPTSPGSGQLAAVEDSPSLGVTVGGGLPHPTNLAQASGAPLATATPDLDAAAISKKYLEHVQLKNARLASSGASIVNSSSPSGSAGSGMPSSTLAPRVAPGGSAPAGLPGAAAPTASPSAMPSAATYPYAQSAVPATTGLPYGTTGNTSTPYVRSAPDAQTSGATRPTTNVGSGAGQAPLGMIGQSGYATAPTGDFVGGAPTPVTGTLGFATSTVGGMPTGARPTGTTGAGATTATGSASPYGATPQYR
ncbi:MAG: hypothetical protein ACTHOU_16840 [Aureliella sp.]